LTVGGRLPKHPSVSQVLRAYQRRTLAADALIASTYLAGTNTRRVRRALKALFGGAVGKDTVSRVPRLRRVLLAHSLFARCDFPSVLSCNRLPASQLKTGAGRVTDRAPFRTSSHDLAS
jgi:hypothetical protein